MAKSTRQYVFEGMELLPEALIPFVERRLAASLQGHWQIEVAQRVGCDRMRRARSDGISRAS